jgi:hypothetical protein
MLVHEVFQHLFNFIYPFPNNFCPYLNIPGNVEHDVEVLEDTVVIEVFFPAGR